MPRLFEPRNDGTKLNFESVMKRNILSYTAPEVNIFEVVAERGYNVSEPVTGGVGSMLPGFGSEEDDLIY